MSQFYNKFHIFQLNFVNILNSYRHYIFDETASATNGMSIYELIEMNVVNTYNSINSDLDYIEHFISSYVPKNEETLELLSNKNLCSYFITDYFNSTEECLNRYGNSLKYNFNIFATCFLQEIRVLKNLITYLLNGGIIRGSLKKILIPAIKADPLMPLKGGKIAGTIYRLDVFNNETLHSNLNIQFINIILPYLYAYKNTLFKYLLIEGDEFYFILISSLYLLLLIVIFFGYWLPIINHLNNIIYKTKNMLSIIPTSILAYQNNTELLAHLSN